MPNNSTAPITPTFESRFEQVRTAIRNGIDWLLVTVPSFLWTKGPDTILGLAEKLDVAAKNTYFVLRMLAAPLTILLIVTGELTNIARLALTMIFIGAIKLIDEMKKLADKLDTAAKNKHFMLRVLAMPLTALLHAPLLAVFTSVATVLIIQETILPALSFLGAALTSPFIFLAHHLYDNRVPKAASSEVEIPGSTATCMSPLVDMMTTPPEPVAQPIITEGDTPNTPVEHTPSPDAPTFLKEPIRISLP